MVTIMIEKIKTRIDLTKHYSPNFFLVTFHDIVISRYATYIKNFQCIIVFF